MASELITCLFTDALVFQSREATGLLSHKHELYSSLTQQRVCKKISKLALSTCISFIASRLSSALC